jgi:hypothetical protein
MQESPGKSRVNSLLFQPSETFHGHDKSSLFILSNCQIIVISKNLRRVARCHSAGPPTGQNDRADPAPLLIVKVKSLKLNSLLYYNII